MNTYKLVGEWINLNTPPASTIIVGDLGIVGFYAHRRIVDSPGLIVPDMYFKQPEYATLKFKTDYVVATQFFAWKQIVDTDWFQYHYMPAAQLSTAGDGEFSPMTVFQRRLDTAIPDQIIQGFDFPLTCSVELDRNALPPREVRARLLNPSGEPWSIKRTIFRLSSRAPADNDSRTDCVAIDTDRVTMPGTGGV
jgi:hypothetical protein